MTRVEYPLTWDYVELLADDDYTETLSDVETQLGGDLQTRGSGKEPYGPPSKAKYADTGKQGDSKKRYPLDTEAHVRAAWSYINMPKNAAKYSSGQLATIKSKIKAAAKRMGITISEDSKRSADTEVEERPKAPVELRNADVNDVNVGQRIVTLIVAPYEQPTQVAWHGEMWTELFERTAWNGIEKRPNRVRANRAHDKRFTCGKAIKFFPQREEGLVAEIRMAQTPLGDETLELARDDMLSASAGFASLPADQNIDRREKIRRIKTAYLDHISFVEDPAYPGAEILSVRETESGLLLAEQEPLPDTPLLDQWLDDDMLSWASKRVNR